MSILRDATGQHWSARRCGGAAPARHRQNLANIDTPGYRRSVVRFTEALADALSTHDDPEARARRVRETVPRVERVETSLRADGNNVEIDLEAACWRRTASTTTPSPG